MRGKQAPKRKIQPDSKYNRQDVGKFINYIMQRGKKTVAKNIVYEAFDIIQEKTKKNGLQVFEQAMKKVGPTVEVRGKRVGGANYQVPFPVRDDRRITLASRWIIGAAQAVKGKPMAEKLAQVLMDSARGEGPAIKKREDVHRMADANKAFAHFARFG
ncbi:30S ribosomal protein S7 [Candidatus Kuenenbacteria bacterium CG10_big_fil_rev_8_21_14_0_10_36_11]|uniref:Small ribosomal subunit protein uS7 n=1 Tax=Candidatus Kuenenbacteria bacterium CG10_big_fil_rev_8_21_14_0_10_36_11 TaxID=1974618 RepID=A0A2M6WAE6_9BACT|nr:MAG: 30S ribosomal protein S7 [Candidatus Kuenenbacteria bacterium CG10_big_fil_rev_8_21_14_0_10_36_11]